MASEMVGEILKLAISVTLVTVFSLGVYAYLPEERVPYVEIETSWNATNPAYVDITHVGGDTIQASDITLQIVNSSDPSDQLPAIKLSKIHGDIWRFPQTVPISLNTENWASSHPKNVTVTVIHPRAILAEGTV